MWLFLISLLILIISIACKNKTVAMFGFVFELPITYVVIRNTITIFANISPLESVAYQVILIAMILICLMQIVINVIIFVLYVKYKDRIVEYKLQVIYYDNFGKYQMEYFNSQEDYNIFFQRTAPMGYIFKQANWVKLVNGEIK